MKKILVVLVSLSGALSLNSQKMSENKTYERALFASGCYWGTEYFLQKVDGVIETNVGYTGGSVENPSYKAVCSGTTGHAETVEVVFDPEKTDYETLCKIFFETHDPTQVDRQGPDIGTQYRSEIFYLNDNQKEIAEKLKSQLILRGFDVATKITAATIFYREQEEYHHDYYDKKGGTPYCHAYKKKF